MKITLDRVTRSQSPTSRCATMRVKNGCFVQDKAAGRWQWTLPTLRATGGRDLTVDIYIATLAWGSSIQLSCHDNGWTGFPLDKSPYVAQGSRALFGYSFLFSPMIPIFFSGEEFDATFMLCQNCLPTYMAPRMRERGAGCMARCSTGMSYNSLSIKTCQWTYGK